MPTEHETLTTLVATALDNGLTYRVLEDRAVDPETGYHPARATLWKIAKGQDVQLTPALVRAVAAAIGVTPSRAQLAAAVQYAGYSPTPTSGGVVLRGAGAPPTDLAAERAVIQRWDKEEGSPE
jgi:hypothetical protein